MSHQTHCIDFARLIVGVCLWGFFGGWLFVCFAQGTLKHAKVSQGFGHDLFPYILGGPFSLIITISRGLSVYDSRKIRSSEHDPLWEGEAGAAAVVGEKAPRDFLGLLQ